MFANADTGSAGLANCSFDFKVWVEWVRGGSGAAEAQSTQRAGMKGQDTTQKRGTRGPRKISDETNQGRSEQSQRNETQMEGAG